MKTMKESNYCRRQTHKWFHCVFC